MRQNWSTALVALAAATAVSGQTYSRCDPTKQDGCPADPAFGYQKASCSFSRDTCGVFTPLEGTTLSYDNNGAVFKIERESNAPTVQTDKYIFFGRVDVVVQAAPGRGIVTSAVLQSDNLDEIDWEWIGGDNAQVQTNYFSKGDTTTYDRGKFHPVSNPISSFHTYTIEWTKTKVVWSIDGGEVRTLLAQDAKGGSAFPQTPMQVKLGTWVAGRQDAAPGTVQWAGGMADWSKAPFVAYYKSIIITDYAGGDGPGRGANQYIYGDKSGSWQSIRVQ